MKNDKDKNENIKRRLNKALINHYVCFSEERFYLDAVHEDYVSVVTTSISDKCPVKLCEKIARYIKKFYLANGLQPTKYIYVGAWLFQTSKL